MANLANKYKLGIFVVGAFIIFLVALILFGFFAFMKPKIKCMTIVDSSVQGLSVGAKVKFSGVPIGEITNIKISTGNLVYIYMEIYSNALAQSNSEDADMSLSEYITEQVKNGLRCQLMYEGITGALYQELQFVDLFQFPSNTIPKPTQDILYIPSIPPVLFGSIIKRIDVSLGKMSGIDKIFKDVGSALAKVNTYLGNPKIDDVINNFNQISQNIDDVTTRLSDSLTKEKIEKVVSELTDTMTEIRQVVNNLNRQINESKLPETSADARVLMKMTVKQLGTAVGNFNTTAKSIKNLTNQLDNNPSSVIWGSSKEKVVPSY